MPRRGVHAQFIDLWWSLEGLCQVCAAEGSVLLPGGNQHKKDHQQLVQCFIELQGLEEPKEAQVGSGDVKRLAIARNISVALEGAAAHAAACPLEHRDRLNFAEAVRSIGKYARGSHPAVDTSIMSTIQAVLKSPEFSVEQRLSGSSNIL